MAKAMSRTHAFARMMVSAAAVSALMACTEKKPMPTQPATVTTVAIVDVVPDTASMGVGQTRQFNALVLDRAGNPVDGKEPSWSSSNPAIAVISSSGLMLAKSVGLATITATADGRSGSAAVAVR
jgi:uncharacterized protein YjdB